MNNVSIGDMAQTFMLRRHNVEIKTQIQRLTAELTSGKKSDLADAVAGDFKALAGIEHRLTTLKAYHTATAEAALFTGTLQNALEVTQQLATDVAPSLTSAGTGGGFTEVNTTANEARQKLFSTVSALNARVGDRYLLSGAATDQKPILGAQDILDALTVATTGQIDAAGTLAAIDTWFDAPYGGGGYLDAIYGGAAAPLAPFAIGPQDAATMTITAADETLRETLKGLAIGAMVAEGALSGNNAERALMVKTAGETLLGSGVNLAGLRANLGTIEGHVGDISTRNAAETTALEIARNGIIAADPFTTASDLETVTTQLETLYTLTARLSRLSLADFLR
jgi:flagellar hook-associated protein 3 FlgL